MNELAQRMPGGCDNGGMRLLTPVGGDERLGCSRRGFWMKKLNVRQGIVGGGIVALISAAGIAGRSPDPLPTFASGG